MFDHLLAIPVPGATVIHGRRQGQKIGRLLSQTVELMFVANGKPWVNAMPDEMFEVTI